MPPESSPATAVTTPDSGRVSSSYPNYAFLVHSQTSLIQNLPPKIDTGMLARQKRRRTSPADHAILEAAYQKNSKPDKAERTEIVNRVALGEKEVQIWFQNRRQNDRRKSRPLLPHELAPHLRNPYSPDLFQRSFSGSSEGFCNTSPTTNYVSYRRPSSSSNSHPEEQTPSRVSTSSIHDLLNPTSSAESHPSPPLSSPSFTEKDSPDTSQSFIIPPEVPSEDASHASKHGENGKEHHQDISVSPSGTKRNHDEIDGADKPDNTGSSPIIPALQSQSSNVRLSISMDGAVKVKTTAEDTPSPPKQRLLNPNGGLKRSQSAVDPGQLLKESQEGESRFKPCSSTFSRSRDTRTWEFYCDSDARDALSSHAERERNGSAVGTLNLIRSQSQKSKSKENEWQKRKAMTPRIGAGNLSRPSTSRAHEKPKLARSMSSMGRLQSSNTATVVVKASTKNGRPAIHVRLPSGDSDKENWAPGTRSSNNPLRRQPDVAVRSPLQVHILEDSDQIPTITAAASPNSIIGDNGASPVPASKELNSTEGSFDKENANPKNKHERVDSLIGSVDGASTSQKEEDLDCIQGLLSLSKGAWR